jgi:glycine/D-amino acid oxidase-like deaminating enzyme
MNLQTYTPALGLDPSPSDPNRWVVHTARGDIDAETVIVTTNAYTSSLLPEFKEKIVPVRGTVCSITPAESHSPAGVRGTIPYTYGFRHATGDTDYMIARQGGPVTGRGDRSIILGGAKSTFLRDEKLWYNNHHDDEEMPGARKYFEGFMKKHMADWNGNAQGNVDHVWSGGKCLFV